MDNKQVIIRGIPAEFYREFKAICARKGISVKEQLITLIRLFVAENRTKEIKTRDKRESYERVLLEIYKPLFDRTCLGDELTERENEILEKIENVMPNLTKTYADFILK